jgi:hypothetical protein
MAANVFLATVAARAASCMRSVPVGSATTNKNGITWNAAHVTWKDVD